jgi:hypothetical protein
LNFKEILQMKFSEQIKIKFSTKIHFATTALTAGIQRPKVGLVGPTRGSAEPVQPAQRSAPSLFEATASGPHRSVFTVVGALLKPVAGKGKSTPISTHFYSLSKVCSQVHSSFDSFPQIQILSCIYTSCFSVTNRRVKFLSFLTPAELVHSCSIVQNEEAIV